MSFLRKGRVREESEGSLVCPRDRATLEKVIVEGVTIDRCGQCRGAWFDAGELRRVSGERRIERDATKPRRVPLRSDFPCPRCGAACELSFVEEVQVDACTSCRGVWLDGGELEEARRQVEVRRVLAEAGRGFRELLVRL